MSVVLRNLTTWLGQLYKRRFYKLFHFYMSISSTDLFSFGLIGDEDSSLTQRKMVNSHENGHMQMSVKKSKYAIRNILNMIICPLFRFHRNWANWTFPSFWKSAIERVRKNSQSKKNRMFWKKDRKFLYIWLQWLKDEMKKKLGNKTTMSSN